MKRTPPIKQGAKCLMKDGTVKYVILVHRPGNGYGVDVSDKQPSEINWGSAAVKETKYYPWNKFRDMIDKII